nr:ABC transporter permease [Bacilli bacterium]
MIVFKTVLKVINRLKGMLILYTVVLVAISLMNQFNAKGNVITYQETKPDIVIYNKDDSLLAKEFVNYMSKHTNIKDIKEDKLDDALFYRDVSYALFIDSNFSSNILNGNQISLDYKSTGDYNSSYTEMLVNKYVKVASIYKDYYSGEELTKNIEDTVSKEIKVNLSTKLDVDTLSYATSYFNFLNYSFLAGSLYVISMVLSSIKEEKVYKRTIISSYDYKKHNKEVLLANSIVLFGLYIIYMIFGYVLFKNLIFTPNGLLYVLNSFVYVICTVTIGFLIGTITQNRAAISGIINVVALGTSFLCGCFVPIEYMPESVVSLSKILPTHYFVSTNEIIKTLDKIDFNSILPIITNLLIIVVFSLVFVILTNIINKKKQKIA